MQVDDLQLTSQSMTIDPSVIQSRILQSASIQKEQQVDDDGMVEQPQFPELTAVQASGGKVEYRRVRCPPHRYTPLREHWEQILTPLVEYLKLQVSAAVEARGRATVDSKYTRTRIAHRTKMHPLLQMHSCCSWAYNPFIQEASNVEEEMGR